MDEEMPKESEERVFLTSEKDTPHKWGHLISGSLTFLICIAYTCVGPLLIMLNKVLAIAYSISHTTVMSASVLS